MIGRSQIMVAPVSPAALIISMPDGPATLQSVKKAQDKRVFRLLVFFLKKNVAPHQMFGRKIYMYVAIKCTEKNRIS